MPSLNFISVRLISGEWHIHGHAAFVHVGEPNLLLKAFVRPPLGS
jgi:hypothetical protein